MLCSPLPPYLMTAFIICTFFITRFLLKSTTISDWVGMGGKGFFWSKFQVLNRLMAIVFFSLLPLSAAASLSRISSLLFVKESRVICSFHLRDFKRISFPYECWFSCTYYETLYVYVIRHAFFYDFQTGMKYVLLFGPSLPVNRFQKIPSSLMWSSMTW